MHLRIHTLQVVLPLLVAFCCCALFSDAQADTIVLSASKDNTLFNSSTGSVSNGTGTLFAGRTGNSGPGVLRALLAFDLAADIPTGSTITAIELTLNVLQAGPGSGADSFSLHRVEQDWGEGTSNASTGVGASATSGDATWIHTFFDSSTWRNPGGDFNKVPSAAQIINGTGPTTWGSTSGLVADVQSWLDDSGSNFGWILIGDEGADKSARQFDSREASSNAPQLTVTFTSVPEPHSLALAMLGSAAGLSSFRRRRR